MEAGMYQQQVVMISKSRGSGSARRENLASRHDNQFVVVSEFRTEQIDAR
jgi:hypothetical protein